MEVNDISVLKYPCNKYVELPRKKLTDRLTRVEKDLMLELFVENIQEVRDKMAQGGATLMILSEPLCDLDTRVRIFKDIIRDYGTIEGEKANVIIKQHPRDLLDYNKLFPEATVLDGTFPMEMLNFIENIKADRLVSVYTVVDSLKFVEEKIYLGDDFMDKYEAPEIHRQNEAITD